MPARDFEGGVDIPEHEVVEPKRPAAGAESNPRSPVAEQKPAHVPHSGRRKLCEHQLQLRTLFRLRNAAIGPPGIGAEVDAVVDPR